jgi:Trypsin-like peptidase domain
VRTFRASVASLVVVVCAATLVLAAASSGAAAPTRTRSRAAGRLSPDLFAELSTGIALIRTFNCAGKATGEGTGFLVGTGVVMTARHVIHGACRAKVLLDGSWMDVDKAVSWYRTGRSDLASADVSTLRIHGQADGHVFTIRSWSAALGTNLAAIGHPLGNGLSLTQGKVIYKGHLNGIPVLAVRLLGAEGASGSPLVDDNGNVVGILQLGLCAKDVLGQRTSGVVVGIDLPSWWPNVRRNLCRSYPEGGVNGCPQQTLPQPPPPPTTTTAPPPPPPPTPATGYHVQGCWEQYTGGLWTTVNSGSATTTFIASDLLARGPHNFWAVARLDAPPAATFTGATVSLLEPNGQTFATETLGDWTSAYISWETDFGWYYRSDNSWFFQHPEITGQGTWTFRWTFPDGETCSSSFTVS